MNRPAGDEPEAASAIVPRKVTIFREADARAFHDTGMMRDHSSEAARAGISKMVDAGLAEAFVLKTLFQSPDPDGFSLSYAWFKGNYPLPPHSHDTDCLYYVISGEIHLGQTVLGAGDGFFLPSDVIYTYSAGPGGVELLEFRGSTQFDITLREGTPRAWDRLAGICAANRDLWKNQPPPIRDTHIS